MQLDAQGEALIKSFESLQLTAYQDSRGIWTIGWGHTPASEGQTCTPSQAENWFQQDTAWACRAIDTTVTVPLSQNEFDALVSFTFNVGSGSEAHSTLVKLLNAGDTAGAAAQFLVWDEVDGVRSAGLLRRREAERALFLS